MDVNVVIKDFVSEAYVIERPASTDRLADNVTALISRKGLKIEFGQQQKLQAIHDQMVSRSLPEDIGFLSRRYGKAEDGKRHSVLVSGPRLLSEEQGSPEPAVSLASRTWTMVGHAINGTDVAAAMTFSAMMAVKVAKTEGTPIFIALRANDAFGFDHPVSGILHKVAVSSKQMKSATDFMRKGVRSTMATAKAFASQKQFYDNSLGDDPGSLNPQLGQASTSHADDDVSYEVSAAFR